MSVITDDHDHATNVEVFGTCPVCDTRAVLPPTPAQGEALADEAVTRAGAGAPTEWTLAARDALRGLAAGGEEFTTDELWSLVEHPPEPRAVGAVIRWGVMQGLIIDTGRARKSRRPECHARPVTIWTATP